MSVHLFQSVFISGRLLPFNFPITKLLNYSIWPKALPPPGSSHLIPIIPIWRRFLRCTPAVRQKVYPKSAANRPFSISASSVSISSAPGFCFSISRLPNYSITNFAEAPTPSIHRTRFQPSQFGVGFSHFHANRLQPFAYPRPSALIRGKAFPISVNQCYQCSSAVRCCSSDLGDVERSRPSRRSTSIHNMKNAANKVILSLRR